MFRRILGSLLFAAFALLLGSILNLKKSDISVLRAEPSPPTSVEAVPVQSPLPSPPPVSTPVPDPYADKPEIDIASWECRLVNKDNPLPEDYIPELTDIENGQYFDSRAADALKQLVAAARSEGFTVYITSSYRSFAVQRSLFSNKVSQYISSEGSREAAEAKAKTIVAYPGTSEHQLGLACDIVDKYYQYMNESLENTELLKWMSAHCVEYGFILRYPKDKTDITGVMYEPWHFRYVGKEAASYISKNGLCLEEFVSLYK